MKTNCIVNYIEAGKEKHFDTLCDLVYRDSDKKYIIVCPKHRLSDIHYTLQYKLGKKCVCKPSYQGHYHATVQKRLYQKLAKLPQVVVTHDMFFKFASVDIFDLCKANGYVLILYHVDLEESELHYAPCDIDILRENYVIEETDGFWSWHNDKQDYHYGKFDEMKDWCNLKSIFTTEPDKIVMKWSIPLKTFHTFSNIYIFTNGFLADNLHGICQAYDIPTQKYVITNLDASYQLQKVETN